MSQPEQPGTGPGAPQPSPGYGPPTQAGASYQPIPGGSYPPQPAPYGQPPAPPPPPGGPYGPGGPGGPYGPGGAGGPHGPFIPPPRKKTKLPLILGIGGGALALVLVVAVVAVNRGGGTAGGSPSAPGGPATSIAPAAADNASDAVRGYLEALAANDADKALSYLREAPVDRPLLTRAVLEASSKVAPLSAIEVPDVADSSSYAQVVANYKLGAQTVSEKFSAQKSGNRWAVQRGLIEWDVSSVRDASLPLFVNGVKVGEDKVSLFPGYYTFTTDSRWLTYGSSAKAVFSGPSDYERPRLSPTLNSAGKKAFLAKAKASLKSCVKQRKLRPTGCPNRLRATKGQKIRQSTVRWRLTNNPWRNAKPRVSSNDPTEVSVYVSTRYNFYARGTQSGRSVYWDGAPIGLYGTTAYGDLSKPGIPIKWGN